jgi:hypothetical protein
MSRKTPIPLSGRLMPDRFYRRAYVVANRLLGYGSTQLNAKIAAGEIKPAVSLSRSGRAKGWFGSYLIERQAEVMKAAEAEAAAMKEASENPSERVIYIGGRAYVPLEPPLEERTTSRRGPYRK